MQCVQKTAHVERPSGELRADTLLAQAADPRYRCFHFTPQCTSQLVRPCHKVRTVMQSQSRMRLTTSEIDASVL
jgi:hypothetical protein